MDYQHIANAVADSLVAYSKDESGWKACKKTVGLQRAIKDLFTCKMEDLIVM